MPAKEPVPEISQTRSGTASYFASIEKTYGGSIADGRR